MTAFRLSTNATNLLLLSPSHGIFSIFFFLFNLHNKIAQIFFFWNLPYNSVFDSATLLESIYFCIPNKSEHFFLLDCTRTLCGFEILCSAIFELQPTKHGLNFFFFFIKTLAKLLLCALCSHQSEVDEWQIMITCTVDPFGHFHNTHERRIKKQH